MNKLLLFHIEIAASDLHMNRKDLALWQMAQQINQADVWKKY
jgi:hypothetical protein